MPVVRDVVLVIGGSDSSGGAGIARDLRTLADVGVHGVAVVTAVTAQTHSEVRAIHLVPPPMIRAQIETALASNDVRAIKIGMLGTREAVEAVVASLPAQNELPIVLDPVLAASSGRALLDRDGRIALVGKLFPLATLITPNAPEAAALLCEPPANATKELMSYGTRLLKEGPRAVLIKGGHRGGDEATDLLFLADQDVFTLTGPRLPGSLRGTGCALASAIAAVLARKLPVLDACQEAKRYVAGLFEEAIASL
jgi:hydroxymethylpyrimidine/phosphomethylpyrimidine kinase